MGRNGEHYSPTDGAHPPGVYRVVGTADDVVLLHVADSDGRRVNSGRFRTVGWAELESDFEPATNPDAGVALLRGGKNALSGLYWSIRRFF